MARSAISMKLPPMDLNLAPKPIRRRMNTRTPIGERGTTMVTVRHDVDAKKALLDRIGEIPEGVVQFSRILVAVYQPPVVTKLDSGLQLPGTVSEDDVREYLWQGKVGLVVAKGPQAYKDDDNFSFHGTENNIGDWVWFQPSNGLGCDVNEVFCRVLREQDILGRIPHPDYVW